MKHSLLILWLGWGLCMPMVAEAQDTLTLTDFLQQVKAYHPVAQQASRFEDQGDAQLQAARGNFDPYAYSKFDQKDYDKSRYWRTFDGGLSWQSPLAFSVEGGWQTNNGVFLNPEQTLPDQGQAYLDVILPIGKGLLMDVPRLAVRQAKIGQQDLEFARRQQLNDLLFAASQRYWNWAAAYELVRVVEEARRQAEIRFQAIRYRFLTGDAAGIDTVDAYVQWQSFEVDFLDALLTAQKAEQDMQAFNWGEGGQKTILSNPPGGLLDPTNVLEPESVVDIQQLATIHPDFQRYDFKLANLAAERRYKQEALKPKLDVSYRALSAKTAFMAGEDMSTWWNPEDYKLKISFGFPLFLREARGDLELNDIKQEITRFEQDQKLADILAKLNAANAEVQAYFRQLTISQANVIRYERLLEAEMEKFNLGQSTLFVVNSRAQKLVSSQQKLISVRAKYEQSLIKQDWAAGRLWQY